LGADAGRSLGLVVYPNYFCQTLIKIRISSIQMHTRLIIHTSPIGDATTIQTKSEEELSQPPSPTLYPLKLGPPFAPPYLTFSPSHLLTFSPFPVPPSPTSHDNIIPNQTLPIPLLQCHQIPQVLYFCPDIAHGRAHQGGQCQDKLYRVVDHVFENRAGHC